MAGVARGELKATKSIRLLELKNWGWPGDEAMLGLGKGRHRNIDTVPPVQLSCDETKVEGIG